MKKNTLLILFCLFTSIFHAQKSVVDDLSKLEQLPIYKGCQKVPDSLHFDCLKKKVQKHLSEQLVKINKTKAGNGGRVEVSFVIDKNTKITGIVVEGSGNQYFREFSAEMVKGLKFKEPGKQKGEPVKVAYKVPITVRLKKKK